MRLNNFIGLLWLLVLLPLASCAVKDDEEQTDKEADAARVDSLSLGLEKISPTDQVSLRLNLSYSEDAIFYADERIVVLVKAPRLVAYVPGTARIDRQGPDTVILTAEEQCPNGDAYLRFIIGREDLTTFDDILDDHAPLVIILRGEQVGSALIEARAQYNEVIGSCSGGIISDVSGVVDVVPGAR